MHARLMAFSNVDNLNNIKINIKYLKSILATCN